MNSGYQKNLYRGSIVSITSGDLAKNSSFGTGFVIYQNPQETYLVTCAHVVHKIGGTDVVQADGKQAEVVAIGSPEGRDLAVLRVRGLEDKFSLPLRVLGKSGKKFFTVGYYSIGYKQLAARRPLHGTLDEQSDLGVLPSSFFNTWDLTIDNGHQLEPGYSGSPVIDEDSRAVVGVVCILEGAGQRGFALSIEELKEVWGEEMPASILQDLIVHDEPEYEKQAMLTKLVSIIAKMGIEKEVLERHYQACVPNDPLHINKWAYPKEEDFTALLSQVLRQLSYVPTSDANAIPSILQYAKQLSTCMKDPRGDLKSWINEASQLWNVNPQTLSLLSKELQKEKVHPGSSARRTYAKPPSLMIVLERKNGSKAFFVKAWLRDHQHESLIPLPLSVPLSMDSNIYDKPYTPRTIPFLLQKLLDDVMDYDKIDLRMKKKLRIEYFMPCELFDEEVDSWSTSSDANSLGMRYQVVIRASERPKTTNPFWEEKWKKACNYRRPTSLNLVHWIYRPMGYDSTNVYTNISAFLTSRQIVCLCLLIVPSLVVNEKNEKDLFRAIVTSGIPIAVWPRKLPDAAEQVDQVQDDLKTLLLSHKLSELPNVILELRRQAREGHDHNHLGYHLTLLWDEWNVSKELPPMIPRLRVAKIKQ